MSKQISVVCDNLHTFYDARVMGFLSPSVRKIFKETARREYQKKGKKSVFLNLVYNFLAQMPPEPSYITGPFTLTYHKSKFYNKQIYVFGEAHGFRYQCYYYNKPDHETMMIDEFLDGVFSTSRVFIDFYLEYDAFKNIEEVHEGTVPDLLINKIDNLVQGCLYPNPPKCPWNTMRAHFTDIRRFEVERQNSFLLKLNNQFLPWYISKSEIAKIKIILNRHKKPGAFVEFFFKDIAGISLLVKEMGRSTLSTNQFREILYNFLTDKSIDIKYPHLVLRGVRGGDLFYPGKVNENAGGAQNIILDFYELARIFKKFKVKPGDNQPEEPHHVISYSGDSHSVFLRSALKTLGFEWVKTSKIVKEYSQCADVRGLTPFFPNFLKASAP